jgi:hypothetical protein
MTSKSLWMSIAVAPQAIPLQGDERATWPSLAAALAACRRLMS